MSPDRVITVVEKACGVRCTNLCRPLNSYINRVFELEREDGAGLIVKFYRPNRWSEAALRDEHDFLSELAAMEIPVIAPLTLADGGTLGCHAGAFFTVFPKKGGRSCDEYSEEQWLELGRLLGRVHLAGFRRPPRDRIVLRPDHATRDQLAFLAAAGFMEEDQLRDFLAVANELISLITPLFSGVRMGRIHGDCHFGNLIWRPGESFFLVDFDDMATGPAVQDLWMLLPGYLRDCWLEVDLFLEGYETFFPFDRRTLSLIEPLRAMRYIHFMAWCGRQFAEDGAVSAVPSFGTREYWRGEILDLRDQLDRIREGLTTGEGPF